MQSSSDSEQSQPSYSLSIQYRVRDGSNIGRGRETFFLDQEESHIHSEEGGEYSHITYEHSSDLYPSSDYEPTPDNSSGEEEGTAININQIPTQQWGPRTAMMNPHEKCPICLNQYAIGDYLKVLNCLHRFHADCIEEWLADKNTCPVCREQIRIVPEEEQSQSYILE